MGLKSITKNELISLSMEQGVFKRVLDVGCGEQIYRKYVSCQEYVGIDVEQSGHCPLDRKVDRFFDGENIPFQDDEFDLVLCTEVLEHAIAPDKIMMEMRRVLKFGGILIVTVPSMWGEHEVPFDFRRYTSFGVKKLALDSGFELIKLDRESPGVKSLIQLGLSEVYVSNDGVFKKILAKSWLVLSFFVLDKLLQIEMPRIYLTNLAVLRKCP